MKHILVVEDDSFLNKMVTYNLSADGYDVISASNVKTATQALNSREFDLVLLDINLSDGNGFELCKLIKPQHPDTIVIFLTAHETENMILMSMGAGAVDYVVKGCAEEELLEHIRKAYEGEPMLDARVQHMVLKEYSRLRRSEKSLLFFINNVSQLTPAERSLVRYLLDGMKVKDIAAARCVEVVTVKTQIKGLLRKFGCTRTKEIVEMIHELGVEHLF